MAEHVTCCYIKSNGARCTGPGTVRVAIGIEDTRVMCRGHAVKTVRAVLFRPGRFGARVTLENAHHGC